MSSLSDTEMHGFQALAGLFLQDPCSVIEMAMMLARSRNRESKTFVVLKLVKRQCLSITQLNSALKHALGLQSKPVFSRTCSMQELAVMVARSRNGETKALPVVETTHPGSICQLQTSPLILIILCIHLFT